MENIKNIGYRNEIIKIMKNIGILHKKNRELDKYQLHIFIDIKATIYRVFFMNCYKMIGISRMNSKLGRNMAQRVVR